MISRDRELLACLSQASHRTAEIVLALRRKRRRLSARDLRHPAALLGGMSAALYRRAAELEGLEPPDHIIIDTRSSD